ncbi:MAG: ATP-binding protein [Gallionella sp.]
MLNDLRIKNFRMLEDLHIAKLGRVNLIVGKNNCGKSTVLEALRLYAHRFHPHVLQEIFSAYGESPFKRMVGKDETYNWAALKNLFPLRKLPETEDQESGISLESKGECLLSLSFDPPIDLPVFDDEMGLIPVGGVPSYFRKGNLVVRTGEEWHQFDLEGAISRQVFFGDYAYWFPALGETPCGYVSTQLLPQTLLAKLWDATVWTPDEDLVLEALQLIEPNVHAMRFISDPSSSSNRMSMVRLKGEANPVPLASMGDGMSRILQFILKLFSARSGFLLIDEFENGLHFSVQEKVWRMIFKLAKDLDIQVFATTHSWDCIESFTKVAVEDTNTEGVLLKLARSRLTGKVVARVYDEADLQTITASELEIR